MSQFVLDASVALSWFVDFPVASYAAEVRNRMRGGLQAITPQLWEIEFANGVLVAERRKIINTIVADECIAELERLESAGIEVEAESPLVSDVLRLARTARLAAYDAVYLELAQRKGVPLATLDARLKVAAGKVGVELLR